jgi:heme oxygenase (biliverdin-IX-beta and delta-forming)
MVYEPRRRLRDATQAHHQRLEARLDILSCIATPDGRRALVERFHALHAEAEAALAPWLVDAAGLGFEARRRLPQLARDLVTVGGSAPPQPARPLVVADRAEALGRLYVLEGSTLGGQVIRRHVLERGDDMAGLGFLDPYGAHTGERWRSFLAVLETELDAPEPLAAAVAGAVAGFQHAERRLCGEPARV